MQNEYKVLMGLDIGNTNTRASVMVTKTSQELYKGGQNKGMPKGEPVITTHEGKARIPTGFSRQFPKGAFTDRAMYQRNGLYVGLGAVNGTFIRLMNAGKYDAEYLEPIFFAVFSELLEDYDIGVHLKDAMEVGVKINVVTGMPENFYQSDSHRAQYRNAIGAAMTRCEGDFKGANFNLLGVRPEAADIFELYRSREKITEVAYWLVMDVGFGTLDVYAYDPSYKEISGKSLSKLGLYSMADNYDVADFDEIENRIHLGGRDAVPDGLLDRIVATAERLKARVARQDFPVCLILASGGGEIAKQTDKNRLGRMFPTCVIYGNCFDNADAYLNQAIIKVGGI